MQTGKNTDKWSAMRKKNNAFWDSVLGFIMRKNPSVNIVDIRAIYKMSLETTEPNSLKRQRREMSGKAMTIVTAVMIVTAMKGR